MSSYQYLYENSQSLIDTTIQNHIKSGATFYPTYIYIKRHKRTGMLYLGKTTSHNPYSYMGSGKKWKNHCIKHGTSDIDTVSCVFFSDLRECVSYAITISLSLDVVGSNEWANLIIENGLDGFPSGTAKTKDHLDKIVIASRNNGWYEELSRQQSERQREIIDGCLNRAQVNRRKQYENQLSDIDDKGYNGAQRAAFKYHETLQKTIDESTGLSKAALRIQRQKETIKSKGLQKGSKNNNAKKIWIYNASGEVMHRCFGNFKRTCLENNLPPHILANTYRKNTKINGGDFDGWYARYLIH